MLLLRAKLEKMARKRGTGLHGLMCRALFLTVAETMLEGTFEEIWTKHAELERLEKICKRYSAKLTTDECETMMRLRRQIKILKQVDLT